MFVLACTPFERVSVLAALVSAALHLTPLHAGEASCKEVEAAVELGMKQTRIFSTAHTLDANGMVGAAAISTLVIGNTQTLFDGPRQFGPRPIESPQMRELATGLAAFAPGDECRALGTESVATRPAMKFAYTTDLGNGPVSVVLWIDKATRLPVKARVDEPDADVDVQTINGRLSTRNRTTGKRVLHVTAFIYGSDVVAASSKGLDANMNARAMAILK